MASDGVEDKESYKMLKRLVDAHARLANGKIILFLLLLFLLANLVIVPAIYPKFQTLDTLLSYSPKRAYELISSYGEQGRQYYAVIEATLDVLYPLITALMFSLLILYTFKRGFPNNNWVSYLSLAPYAILLADYLENVCVVTMLLGYPRELVSVAKISNFFTITKFALTPLQLLFIVGLVGWLIRVIRSRYQIESVENDVR
jgi:hypothetical protein